MTVSIPASHVANITPSVINAGGTGLDFSGLCLTTSSRVPVGVVQAFVSQTAVAAFFGGSSPEAAFATRYFAGYDNSPLKPAQVLFAQYALTAVPAWLQGGSLAGMTLQQLQAITGTIELTIDGTDVTSSAFNLSAATSFSNAAALIQTALGHFDAVVTGGIAGNTLTVSAVASGALAIGQVISGTGVTPGTKISALGTGTGGTGTYTVDTTQTTASTTISAGPATVVFDSVSSAFIITGGTPSTGTITAAVASAAATALALTTAAGAITSQGNDADTPGEAMDAIVAQTQNFVTFTTLFNPVTADKVAFGAWTNTHPNRFMYVMWDNDVTATTSSPGASAGAQIIAAGYAATMPFYEPVDGAYKAAFVMGGIASIDFTRANGRTNITFRTQSGLLPGVTNEQIATQLETNGYNYYGRFATANAQFTFIYNGQVTGPFLWVDSLMDVIWITNNFQLALMNLLTSIPSIPYNSPGKALIEAALQDPITAAVTFGAIRPGITLSSLQAAQVNNEANAIVDGIISQRGWYLQVADATPQVRAARGSPPITFWYTDGQSVQKLNVNAVEIQ